MKTNNLTVTISQITEYKDDKGNVVFRASALIPRDTGGRYKLKMIEAYEEATTSLGAITKLNNLLRGKFVLYLFLLFFGLSFGQCYQPDLETKIQLQNKNVTIAECFNIYTESAYFGKFPDARRGHLIKSNVFVTAFTVGKGEYRIYFADVDKGLSKLTIENCNKAVFNVWQEVYDEVCRIEVVNNNECEIIFNTIE